QVEGGEVGENLGDIESREHDAQSPAGGSAHDKSAPVAVQSSLVVSASALYPNPPPFSRFTAGAKLTLRNGTKDRQDLAGGRLRGGSGAHHHAPPRTSLAMRR